MINKINSLKSFLKNRKLSKYARLLEDIELNFSEEGDLSGVPDDVFAFTLAFLEVYEERS